jgi:5'-deoxynucleotidase YfbR-like HD superfamily hydrolase
MIGFKDEVRDFDIQRSLNLQMNPLYNLKNIIRYNNVEKINTESVAEHTFFVMSVVNELHNFYDFNLGKALQMALVHDYPEIYIDDIAWPIKNAFPKVAKALKEAEEEAIEKFSPNVIEAFFEYEEKSGVEALVVSFADMYSVCMYSESEKRLGNASHIKHIAERSKADMITRMQKLQEFKR